MIKTVKLSEFLLSHVNKKAEQKIMNDQLCTLC